MTTDFQGKIAGGYKDIFAMASQVEDTQLIVNDTIIDLIKQNSPVSARLDERVITAALTQPTPIAQPAPARRSSQWFGIAGFAIATLAGIGLAVWMLKHN